MLTAITGGIGSGKSVVCNLVKFLGYPVYDCDSRAKRLMDNDLGIKKSLKEKISEDVVFESGEINRARLSQIVFSDPRKLDELNRIVHASVRDDLKRWVERHRDADRLFVETAILYQSGLDAMVDDVWEVIAPRELRVERVMKRNGCLAEEVERRIASQNYVPSRPHEKVYVIENDGTTPILPRILDLLRK